MIIYHKIVITIIVKPRTHILYLYEIVLFSIDIVNATVYNHWCLIHISVCVTVIILRVLAETITKGKLFLSIPAALLEYYVLIQYSKSYCSQLRPNAGPAVNRPYLFLDSRNSLSLLADHDFCFFVGKNKIPSANMFHQRPVSVATKRSKALTSSFKNVGGRKNWRVGYLKYLRQKLFYVYMVNLCFTSRHRWLGCACALIFQCLHMHQYMLF
jgi:hypothetical protein